jgi:hypothetical protein
LVLAVLTVTVVQGATAQDQRGSPPSSSVLCSTLEVKTAERMGVALVSFHQANKSDGPRLGELLRQNDGVSVEFETSDGQAHTATLFRLGTCFGRGLIVFPTGSARLTPRDRFRLRFPPRRNSG